MNKRTNYVKPKVRRPMARATVMLDKKTKSRKKAARGRTYRGEF